ncbi:uncharacterized protein PV09_08366 [Verruconis gallopava]|uniref:GDP/GTP exchange factor Sec2 N-terminal domain-containing protein n=1 Tax=Verruconis gallopava TaxID=253628 RepID=A0A0D2ALQ1_9PEZI|nr:uncharacterized protein PV09_08366 [Verruconis gallopava]KIW00014.1 hypothetical protein PV09_08366 [Verruconis gallopava]
MATATVTTVSTVCPNCGATCSLHESESTIAELQAQIRLLTEKASSAVDKLADCEDELRRLRAQAEKQGPPTPPAITEPPAPSSFQSRFGASLFGARKPLTASAVPTESAPVTDTPGTSRESDLQAALVKEQNARRMADAKVSQMNQEIEDLSVQLFQQANEMVATERKARAKLEERIETLEKRDVEKRRRLEKLESALNRIEKVRGLLAPPGG